MSTLLTKYSGDRINSEMGLARSAYGGEERCIRSFGMEA